MSPTIHHTGFTRDQLSKIGNTIIYLAQQVPDLNKTKILKVLFLLEEASIKKYGTPFFGLEFQLWKHGPVVKDIFIDLSSDDNPVLLGDYIRRAPENASLFVGIKDFSDDEFSDNDLEILDKVIEFTKTKNARYLVNHTHGNNSLWRKSAIKHGVLELLEKELVNSTEFEVDFALLFDKPSPQQEKFEESKENSEIIRQLKS